MNRLVDQQYDASCVVGEDVGLITRTAESCAEPNGKVLEGPGYRPLALDDIVE